MTITPPFAYYGGKTKLADAIVERFPQHEHYVEPFAGSLAVLLAKPRSEMETVNDLDGDIMTFWRILRDEPSELQRLMDLTPHSRAEHQAAYDLDSATTDLERARRVWVLLSQARGGTMRRTGWRFYRDPAGGTSFPEYLEAYASRVPACAHRIHGVTLENRPALEVIRDYGQHPNVLLYIDPPYLATARNSTNYRHEMPSEAQHRELAEALLATEASVVLSGYHSALYDKLYGDWDRVELAAWTGNGIRAGATKTQGIRTEVLWSNRAISVPDLLTTLVEEAGRG